MAPGDHPKARPGESGDRKARLLGYVCESSARPAPLADEGLAKDSPKAEIEFREIDSFGVGSWNRAVSGK